MGASISRLAAALVVATLFSLAACGAPPTGGQALSGRSGMVATLKSTGLVIVALDQFTKRRLKVATPLAILERAPKGEAVPARFDIDERTEFHAFYSPPGKARPGLRVAFVWRYGPGGSLGKLYCQPSIQELKQRPGFPRPFASNFIWSKPSLAAGTLTQVTRPVQSRAAWLASRAYGTRSLIIREVTTDKAGKPALGQILATARFEIYHRGVMIY